MKFKWEKCFQFIYQTSVNKRLVSKICILTLPNSVKSQNSFKFGYIQFVEMTGIRLFLC